MRTSNQLYKEYDKIVSECKENICREFERIGKTEFCFEDYINVAVWLDSADEPQKERITSIAINESGQLYCLYSEYGYEVEIKDIIKSEWLYIWETVENECRGIPTMYYTERLYHDKQNKCLKQYYNFDIEESGVQGLEQARESLVQNYKDCLNDEEPEHLPVFFLSVRENGRYIPKYALVSTIYAEKNLGYSPTELANVDTLFMRKLKNNAWQL